MRCEPVVAALGALLRLEKIMVLDAIIRKHFFDLMASVVLPGPEDVT